MNSPENFNSDFKVSIELMLSKLIELQNQFNLLQRNYKYDNGWDYPELEDNLKKQKKFNKDILNEFENTLILKPEKDLVWGILNVPDWLDKTLIMDYYWSKKKDVYQDNLWKRREKEQRKNNSFFRTEESEEDRIMRRLREGDGDLEGF